MTRRMTPSQFRSHLQQLQSRQRQAISRYNEATRQHNRKVNAAIDKYNREVRAYNARVRAYRQRVQTALSRLQSRTVVVTRYVRFRASVETLHQTYVTLDAAAGTRETSDFENEVLELSERENANSLDVMNELLADGAPAGNHDDLDRLRDTEIDGELRAISPDLDSRWKGALFSLHPANPDASRHFCTSAREIFTAILERQAPDEAVKQAIPGCQLTTEGRPTRRARIQYALVRKGLPVSSLQDFIEQDVENILELFGLFNDGTHGSAGRFEFSQLVSIKRRVEDGLRFFHKIFA